MKPLRILFAGTPDFAVPALSALVGGGFCPLTVLCQPDRPAGRGRKMQPGPVKQAAMKAGIPVLQPDSFKDRQIKTQIEAFRADLMVVVAYGLILPAEILKIPTHGCWNIHASLLPRWRGAAPIQRSIEAGDTETGVSIMQMDEGLDTGAVRWEERVPIAPDETGGSLHDKLAALGASALLHCIEKLARGEPPAASPQAENGVTYAAKLQKSEAELDWRQAAITLERKVRAFNPWPVAWCRIGSERTRIWAARALPADDASAERSPGTVLASGARGIDIATGEGVLRVSRLQRPGGLPIEAADYLNASSLPATLAAAPDQPN